LKKIIMIIKKMRRIVDRKKGMKRRLLLRNQGEERENRNKKNQWSMKKKREKDKEKKRDRVKVLMVRTKREKIVRRIIILMKNQI